MISRTRKRKRTKKKTTHTTALQLVASFFSFQQWLWYVAATHTFGSRSRKPSRRLHRFLGAWQRAPQAWYPEVFLCRLEHPKQPLVAWTCDLARIEAATSSRQHRRSVVSGARTMRFVSALRCGATVGFHLSGTTHAAIPWRSHPRRGLAVLLENEALDLVPVPAFVDVPREAGVTCASQQSPGARRAVLLVWDRTINSWKTLSRVALTCGWTSAYRRRRLVMFCTWWSARSKSWCTRLAKCQVSAPATSP